MIKKLLSPLFSLRPISPLGVLTMLAVLFVLFAVPTADPLVAGLSDNVNGYAWSENVGWISFNCLNTNSCGQSNYGVHIDGTSGQFSGYAWSEHIGWIDFAPFGSGGDNYPSAPYYSANLDFDSGQITGWARACAVFVSGCSGNLRPSAERGEWDGWIKISETEYTKKTYGVTRVTTGPGTCELDGYAWGGDVIGWIHFNGNGYHVGTTLCQSAPTVEIGGLTGTPSVDVVYSTISYQPIDWLDFDTIITEFNLSDLGFNDLFDFADWRFDELTDFLFQDIDFLFEDTLYDDMEAMLLGTGQECINAISATINAEIALTEAQLTGDPEQIRLAEIALADARQQEDARCTLWNRAEEKFKDMELAYANATRADNPISVNYCTAPLQPTFFWIFKDPDPGDYQTAYQVQVATGKNFQSKFIVADSGKTPSQFSNYIVRPGTLSFGTKYYWRVRVWDSTDVSSDWTDGPSYVSPPHAFPSPKFSYSPPHPTIRGVTRFTDQSTSEHDTSIVRRRWRFDNAIPGVSREPSPQTSFQSAGTKAISLEVTDSDGLTCSTDQILPQSIRIISPVEFKEI